MGLINYLGNSKVIKRICQLLKVTDVQENGVSIVDENGIAHVTGGGGGSSTLADLTDVDVTGASGGDVLALNGTSGKWEEKTLATVATSGSYNDLSNKPTIPAAQIQSDFAQTNTSALDFIKNKPTKLSDFNNDSGFITNTVNNLTNYYKKSETYTQAEVDALISAVVTIDIEVVQALPTTDISTTTIYLLPKQTAGTDDVYDEYINTTGTSAGWELIGSTQVDLSNYYTKSEVDALIPDELADLADDSTHRLVTDTEKTAWNGKSVVSANPQSTTGTLSGLEIDGVAYEIPSGSGVQADWNETDSTADDYIKNKPTIPTVTADGAKQGVGIDSAQYRANLVHYRQLSYLCGEHAYSGDVSNRTYEIILDQVGRLCVIIPWESFVKSDWNATSGKAEILNKPTKLSDFSNDLTSVKDYNNSVETQFGYSTTGMSQSNVTWLCAWDTSVSGKYRIRGVKQADLKVAYATSAGSATDSTKVAKNGDTMSGVLNIETSGTDTPLVLKGSHAQATFIHLKNNSGNTIGYLYGTNNGNRAGFYYSGAYHNFAYTGDSLSVFTVPQTFVLNSGARLINSSSQFLQIGASNESNYYLFLGVDGGAWAFEPNADNKLYLGQGNYRWRTVYAVNGSINTSDRNQKRDIKELGAFAKDFIMGLKPVSFKRIDGDRTHYGMVAQDVEETMSKFGLSDMDFAGFCKDQKSERYEDKKGKIKERTIEGEYIYGLRYEEFIAPLIKTVQLQQEEIEMLKKRLDALENN